MRPIRSLLVSLVLAATIAALALGTASATFPGHQNGRIAFGVRAADGSANIFSINPDGSAKRQLTTGAGNHLCAAYEPNGRQMLYCADTSGAFEIWTMKANGTNRRQVTHLNGFATFPDMSPDHSRIVFGGVEGSDQNNQIYTVSAATGGDLRTLTSCAGYGPGCYNDLAAWSPDGRKIAFLHADDYSDDDGPVNSQVWVMNADGSNPHALTSDAAPKDQVADWSPDGTKIAFHAGGFGMGGIWVINADGTSAHQLNGCLATDPWPCATGDEWGPAWSPDGTKIVYLHDLGALGGTDRPVYVMNADGSGQHRVSAAHIKAAVPAWQPLGVGSN